MYRYISIRSDSKYSKHLSSDEVSDFMDNCSELKKNSRLDYVNNDGFPWMQLAIVFGDKNGNYNSQNPNLITKVNLIELLCKSDGSDACFAQYLNFAKKISNKFDWEIYDNELDT